LPASSLPKRSSATPQPMISASIFLRSTRDAK